MKSIPLKTWEARAILDNHKSVIRRVVKPQPEPFGGAYIFNGSICTQNAIARHAPYRPGDILYVRETWKQATCDYVGGGYGLADLYLYKADEPVDTTRMMVEGKWHSSIHMPREAARIFLQVTDVRVERLQDIDDDGVVAEGLEIGAPFDELWDSTIKPADRALYGWDTNPWVFVISFERISKDETLK